jgi:coiled-coil and C2 domain-containing protein 2A
MLYAKKWQNKLNEEFPERNIKALVININAKSVLVSRYLRSLKPPEEFLTNLNATNEIMKRLARFVSLIPKVPDSIALPGICDIWCSSDQFLEMLMGDEEEHAILLCNYFLYLGKRASILLGYGIPEGSTAYVIVDEYGQEPHVFNASTGEQFSVKDNYLPLNSIGCIISQENVKIIDRQFSFTTFKDKSNFLDLYLFFLLYGSISI